MTEEEVYFKALGVLNDALDGRTVNPVAVDTAVRMLSFLWNSIYAEHLKRQEIRQKLREEFPDTISEKEGKNETNKD
jgi:hypothetical protein